MNNMMRDRLYCAVQPEVQADLLADMYDRVLRASLGNYTERFVLSCLLSFEAFRGVSYRAGEASRPRITSLLSIRVGNACFAVGVHA